MLYLATFFFILAILLLWEARRRRQSAGIPGGRVIYTDTRAWGAVEKPLFDAETGLTGKPDYLIEKGSQIIPVEVKSSTRAEGPYDSHIYQLAAYCLLVERVMGKRPPYGILHYSGHSKAGRTYAIDYTPGLEAALLELLEEIRVQDKRRDVDRSHESAARCSGCGYRSICEQRL
ncbi:MAG: Dna2/Cas4 domain-containing protein [Anaerolineales bacterium]|jgi:CRISPR-associated exonuclease Cas4